MLKLRQFATPAFARMELQARRGRGSDSVRSTTANDRREAVLFAAVSWMFVIGILSQKISVAAVPGTAIQIVLFLEYGFVAWLAWTKRLTITPRGLAAVLTFFIIATLSSLLADPAITSFMYIFGIYAPFMFGITVSREFYWNYLKLFQFLGLFVSVWAFIDWGFQFSHLPMPNIEHLFPRKILFFNFNYIQTLAYGSKWYKPNAFFFLEVSYVAQMIASAFVIEACLFQRIRYLAPLLVALICTFSGTGFTLILMSLPVILFHLRVRMVAIGILLLPIAGATAIQMGVVDNAVHRSQEFGQENSSGNQRFIAQFEAMAEHFDREPKQILFGIGAGRILQNGYVVWTPISKSMVEYGILTAISFIVLITTASFKRGIPFVVSYVSIIQYFFLNGGFLVPVNVFLIFMLTGIFRVREPDDATMEPGLISGTSTTEALADNPARP